MNLDHLCEAFRDLRVNRRPNGYSPHKPCMLLAVIDLFESGLITENRIRFDDLLLLRYSAFFEVARTESDHLNPWMPFFALKNEASKFWSLQPKPGRDIALTRDSARRKADIVDNFEFAFLSDEAFKLLMNPVDRDTLRDTLIYHWFPSHVDRITELIGVTAVENALKSGKADHVADVHQRSAAFRRLVTEAYEFRCAASGWRVILPDYSVLVEAAHIVPFTDTRDDRPQNGIALTPNFHWALDRHIIAPGPDHKWHVSRKLDPRIPDNKPIVELDGQPLILPRDSKYYPDPDALAWRMDRLR